MQLTEEKRTVPDDRTEFYLYVGLAYLLGAFTVLAVWILVAVVRTIAL